jgi:hypothetical protein
VRRVKRGTPSTHPLLGDELRALRRLQREQEPKSPFVFTSERGAPFSTAGFSHLRVTAGVAEHVRVRLEGQLGLPARSFDRWPTRATTLAPYKPIWGTRTSSTRGERRATRVGGACGRNSEGHWRRRHAMDNRLRLRGFVVGHSSQSVSAIGQR